MKHAEHKYFYYFMRNYYPIIDGEYYNVYYIYDRSFLTQAKLHKVAFAEARGSYLLRVHVRLIRRVQLYTYRDG